MAKRRKFCAYRRIERPYTRVSKYRKKNFTRGNPHLNLGQFEMGNLKGNFNTEVRLVSCGDLQIRDVAIDAARMAANRRMEKKIGKDNFYFKLRIYPHHILRENPLASGAGADRMSTGMAKAFGKTIGKAARVFKGATIFSVKANKQHIPVVKEALRLASHKVPTSCKIIVGEN